MNAKTAALITCSFLLAGCNLAQPTAEPTPTPTTESEAVQTVETASLQIADAFTSGQPLKCEITSSTAGEQPSTYYVKNRKMRMETQPTTEKPTQFMSINDGITVYFWSTDPTMPAMKMSLEDVKKSADSFDNQLQSFPDLTDESERQKITESGSVITCNEATVDDALFVPPSDIVFRDFAEMMGGSMER